MVDEALPREREQPSAPGGRVLGLPHWTAQPTGHWRDDHHVHPARLWFDLTVATVALLFSIAFIYYSRNTGNTWYVTWGPFLMSGAAAGRRTRGPGAAPPHDRTGEDLTCVTTWTLRWDSCARRSCTARTWSSSA